MDIRPDDLSDPRVVALLRAHRADLARHSPPQSVHALDVDAAALRAAPIAFWSVWDGDHLAGCGALKALAPDHGEIKSMRTVDAYRRRGVAARLLEHLLAEARRRGYRRLSLETGSGPAFAPAHALYLRFGFADDAPFADYPADPYSRFLTRSL
ncbi:GNAT family N-acetyltransferase [Dokdonella koreensis]|uniref:Acetyltransferase, GNAT family n=1 Tax=Dokdonella koreensis DS-123 TaxID=1300342 RepID=A0A160DWT4_9GAMM|nr:GNAT family N-acetyltransferase [Dokdonella koreensis]ANB18740.1 Acetyltransferase, GNAT family [Dokdonella koreensis DS-123]